MPIKKEYKTQLSLTLSLFLSLSLSLYLSCSLPLQDSNQTTKSIKGIESSMYNLTYNKRLRMLIKSTVSSRSICFMSLFSIWRKVRLGLENSKGLPLGWQGNGGKIAFSKVVNCLYREEQRRDGVRH